MSTTATLLPQVHYFTQDVDSILYMLVGYCFLGTESEQLYSDDKNAFLTNFLEESVDMMTSISIRASAIELLEECFLQNPNFDRTILQSVLQNFIFDSVPAEFCNFDQALKFP